MKTRIVTIISIAGVLVAGTAAAMVNTQIFESEPTVAGESAALLAPQPTTVALAIADGTDADSTTSTVPADRSSGLLTEFAIGDAGFVTLDVIGGRLRIVSVEPATGWSVLEQEEYPAGDHVEVTLASGTSAIEFEADLVDGAILPEVESSVVVAGEPTSPSRDDDANDHDDDDHDEDDDDEDDDDEDDHDDDHEGRDDD